MISEDLEGTEAAPPQHLPAEAVCMDPRDKPEDDGKRGIWSGLGVRLR
jgi:hypothetical protein